MAPPGLGGAPEPRADSEATWSPAGSPARAVKAGQAPTASGVRVRRKVRPRPKSPARRRPGDPDASARSRPTRIGKRPRASPIPGSGRHQLRVDQRDSGNGKTPVSGFPIRPESGIGKAPRSLGYGLKRPSTPPGGGPGPGISGFAWPHIPPAFRRRQPACTGRFFTGYGSSRRPRTLVSSAPDAP